LVVVGSVSVDRIRTVAGLDAVTVGGAGLYAALGGATSAAVGMVGISSDLPLVDRIEWPDRVDRAGLVRRPGGRVQFDITYDEQWRATYLVDGAEVESLIRYSDLPARYRAAAAFHLCPTGDAATQVRFARQLRERPGTASALLSATTFRGWIEASPADVHRLWRLCDVFVCNAEEACLLTESRTLADAVTAVRRAMAVASHPTVTLVTDSLFGCEVVTADRHRHVAAVPAVVRDPTGAGESFAGAFAAALLRGADVSDAARFACAVGSRTVTGLGPKALLAAPPELYNGRSTVTADGRG
jgi:sugar/nucleoside kinase (ribokinase family)